MDSLILEFWFPENKFQSFWFSSKRKMDKYISETFGSVFQEIETGSNSKSSWKTNPESYLALIIVLDQFSRHIYRSSTDEHLIKIQKSTDLAIEYASDMIEKGWDLQLSGLKRLFVLLPFRHSKQLQNIMYAKKKICEYASYDKREHKDENLSETNLILNTSFYNRFIRATDKQLESIEVEVIKS